MRKKGWTLFIVDDNAHRLDCNKDTYRNLPNCLATTHFHVVQLYISPTSHHKHIESIDECYLHVFDDLTDPKKGQVFFTSDILNPGPFGKFATFIVIALLSDLTHLIVPKKYKSPP